VRDIDLLELELQLADLDSVAKRLEKAERTSRLQKDHSEETIAVLRRVRDHLDSGNPIRSLGLGAEDSARIRDLFLLTAKPILVVANVDENDAAGAAVLERVAARAQRSGGEAVAVSARIEAEVAELEADDQRDFLGSLGLTEPGLDRLARSAYHLLSLITFFTAGEKEVRAWTVRRGETAIDAAGEIHTDFVRGFIRAEVVSAADLIAGGSYAAVREQGRLRLEGRDYLVQDGDVMHFRFNV
jgi:GTP-binding protein YchF